MLSRHVNAIVALLLTVGAARADVCSVEESLDASGCTVSADLSRSEVLRGGQPGWYVQADAFVLNRTSGRNRPLAFASDSGDGVLETSDLHLGFQPGPRLTIGRCDESGCGGELSYFGLHEWTATAQAVDSNNLDIPGTLVGIAEDYSGADRLFYRYSARLHNAEANVVRALNRKGLFALIGLRYLHFNETVVLTATDSDSGTSNYLTESQCDLIGGQLGLRAERWYEGWGWELTMKAGLYGNVMRQQQRMLDNGNTFVIRDASAGAGSTAFLGDLNFTVFRQLNGVWSLRGGYYAMYVGGLALATDQLDFDNLPTSGQGVLHGDLLLHGFALGLEARW